MDIMEFGTPHEGAEYRKTVVGVVYNPKSGKYLYLNWEKFGWTGLVTGGVEENEGFIQAMEREMVEETGYTDFEVMQPLGNFILAHYYAANKNKWRTAEMHPFLVILKSMTQIPDSNEEQENFTLGWDSAENIMKKMSIIPKTDEACFDSLIELIKRAQMVLTIP